MTEEIKTQTLDDYLSGVRFRKGEVVRNWLKGEASEWPASGNDDYDAGFFDCARFLADIVEDGDNLRSAISGTVESAIAGGTWYNEQPVAKGEGVLSVSYWSDTLRELITDAIFRAIISKQAQTVILPPEDA